MSNKTILFIVHQFPSLSETFLYTLIDNLQAIGFNVKVVARYRGNAPNKPSFSSKVKYLPAENRNVIVKCICTLFWLLQYFFDDYCNAIKFVKFLYSREHNIKKIFRLAYILLPLLLIKTDLTYFSFGGLAAKYLEYIKFSRTPSFFSLRGRDIYVDPLVYIAYRQRLIEAMKYSAGIHCVCRDIEEKAKKLANCTSIPTRVIYTAVNPLFLSENIDKIGSLDSKQVRVISFGRLDWSKGFEHGMMAIREVIRSGYDILWDIYGSGQYDLCLKWAIRDLGLVGKVFIHEGVTQHEVAKLLKVSDIYFQPSVREGISNSVIEAMAIGLPVVVCNVGGMSEIIANGENGFLVPIYDWRLMAKIIKQLSVDFELRKVIGYRAKSTCYNLFLPEKQQIEWLNFFNNRQDL